MFFQQVQFCWNRISNQPNLHFFWAFSHLINDSARCMQNLNPRLLPRVDAYRSPKLRKIIVFIVWSLRVFLQFNFCQKLIIDRQRSLPLNYFWNANELMIVEFHSKESEASSANYRAFRFFSIVTSFWYLLLWPWTSAWSNTNNDDISFFLWLQWS